MTWINLLDRLPELYEFVLVCADNQGTNEPKPISIARLNNSGFWEFCNEAPLVGTQGAWMDIEYPIEKEDVTHWMPLPKPPEVPRDK